MNTRDGVERPPAYWGALIFSAWVVGQSILPRIDLSGEMRIPCLSDLKRKEEMNR